MEQLYDVLIIGGGVVGSAIAREMSRYRLKIGVLEKNLDVCYETSGRNSGVVHGGFAYDTGSLKARLCVEGNQLMGQLTQELDVTFQRCGKVLVGNTEEDLENLRRTITQGEANGVQGLRLVDEAELHQLVPAVVGKFAMFSPNSGIVDPFGLTIALAENAHHNGVDYHFGCEVTGLRWDGDGNWRISTVRGEFASRGLHHPGQAGGPSAAHARVPGAQQHLYGHPRDQHGGRKRDCGPQCGAHRRLYILRCAPEEHGLSGSERLSALAPHPQGGLHPQLLRHPAQMGG